MLDIRINKYLFWICLLLLLSNLSFCIQDDVIEEDIADSEDPYKEEDALTPGQVTTTFFESKTQVVQLEWCGLDNTTLLALSQDGVVFRSIDKGTTWENQSQKYISSSAANTKVNVSRMVMSTADKNLVFFLGTAGVNWVTVDWGASLKELNHGTLIHDFVFHPTKREWAMASVFTTCDDFDENEKCKIYKEVYLTTDLGVNWKFLQDFVLQYEFAKKDKDDGIPEKRILMIMQGDQTKSQSPEEWSANNYLLKSDDFFKHTKKVVQGGNQFILTRDYLYVAKVTKEGKKFFSVSKRTSDFLEFTDMKISQKGLHKFDFNIIEANTGGVFLFLTRPDKSIQAGNIYVSDRVGKRFSVTLQGVPYLTKHEFDFAVVESLSGVYIANIYDRIDKVIEEDNEQYYAGNNAKKRSKKLPNRRTMITFNGGGDWQLINFSGTSSSKADSSPTLSAKGKKIRCDLDKGCSLHLHNFSSAKYPYPYSVKSAVGLIIGVGNLGAWLTDNEYELNTYMSRDGGVSWFEIIKGPHIAEYGDHGGIITLAPFKRAKYILYTANEGMSWEKIQLNKPVLISNILIEPLSVSQNFIAIGGVTHINKDKTTFETGALISIDFSQLHEPQCRGVSTPDQEGSDYEIWAPSDGNPNSNGWFLGKKTKFVRRKRSVQCYNGEETEKEIYIEDCPCSKSDYECDEGFKRTQAGDCEAVDSNYTLTIPEVCTDYYYVSLGYRKIPGDTWIGGQEYEQLKVPCPGTGLISLRNILYLSILVAIVYFGYKHVTVNGMPDLTIITKLWSKEEGSVNKKNMKQLPQNDSDDDNDVPIELQGGIKSGKFSYKDEENAEAIDLKSFSHKQEPSKRSGGGLLDGK